MDRWPVPAPFLGQSDAVANVLELVGRAAAFDVPLLLTGETGTGKGHVARLVHDSSRRRTGPFVSVNCAAFPDGLFESELFGHSRGAFTGAVAARVGLFEEAAGGTLFLDEVGELPIGQQVKLLTVLEEHRVRPVGASRPRNVDARVVSATSRDLASEVEAGRFRADLYHRLALLRCEIPPLRARPDDVRTIGRHLLSEMTRRHARPGVTVTEQGWTLLLAHSWPGNVRELAHVLEAALIMSRGEALGPADLEPHLSAPVVEAKGKFMEPRNPSHATRDGEPNCAPPGTSPGRRPSIRYSFFGAEEAERDAVHAALVLCRGNRTRAAAELGMARNTLREKLRRYGLDGREPLVVSETTRAAAASES